MVFVIGVLDRNGWLKFDNLGMDILSIALPAALALAADPIASLVDTAFVGHIGNSMEVSLPHNMIELLLMCP